VRAAKADREKPPSPGKGDELAELEGHLLSQLGLARDAGDEEAFRKFSGDLETVRAAKADREKPPSPGKGDELTELEGQPSYRTRFSATRPATRSPTPLTFAASTSGKASGNLVNAREKLRRFRDLRLAAAGEKEVGTSKSPPRPSATNPRDRLREFRAIRRANEER